MHKLLKSILLLGILITCCWTAQPASATSLSGLKVMKEMAQDAVPYEVAIASQKPTILEFYADWCSVCQSMAPTMQTLEQQYGEDINFVMLNVDEAQWLPQMDQYDVTGVPQFTLLNEQQSLVKSLVGRIPQIILADEFEQLS
ncbi:Thioredoxin 1 [Acaryochloris thomasi RCC1774]|uniref:Thioredoxin 1 n=2 Tax=Acaryochloris TaxID=155977 RepID=A0A2W1JDY2_9CYAN|nr:thioredoxin domain-containing protein [Acaryochloris thomasi]PZD71979.1 Thioredoxin 1 [Acaryochloris thomasi RCC1774]